MDLDDDFYNSLGPLRPPTGPTKTPEELMKDMELTPLFMRSLPSEQDMNDNNVFAALQALAYDGTPEGIVEILSFFDHDHSLD